MRTARYYKQRVAPGLSFETSPPLRVRWPLGTLLSLNN